MLRNVKSYRRPASVEDAVALVHSYPHAAYIGGGAWTVAQGDPTLEVVVDLQDLGLDRIVGTLEDVSIGATATLQAIIDHADAGKVADGILAIAAGYTQSRSLREQGTLGGALIVAGPADPLTTVLLVLETDVIYADPVSHTAPFTSFSAYRDRLIQTKALLTAVKVKRPPARSASAFTVVGRSPKDKPIVCAAAHCVVDEGLPVAVQIAVGGADARPMRLHKSEHLLRGQLLDQEKVERALDVSLAELHPIGDYRGSVDYRMAMAKVLARRAVLEAWQKARRL